ncbi:Ypt/Rab-specific GTPase-activating protein GYP7 and related proteins [Phaffia rhodozyma]|uniref:Ypt/Rab-specific GTPase-activating protein GYP7 and related proteins n=1 Tax=Phaffia rhodozyma TaxID=264483 RepID=A0A0F7SVH8_PHARH|nr:Ypt/Rab-specific GTPase-activating protein GYP7 and related proteins [Phaffia rhodozyma]
MQQLRCVHKAMVEINISSQSDPTTCTDGPSKLLYSKSKVYVHPSSYSKDNVPGFVAIVQQDNPQKTLLSWIPESLARSRRDYDAFVRAEHQDGCQPSIAEENDWVLLQPVPERGESYAFSVPLSTIYSIIVYPPSLTKWYGSLTINVIGGQTLPTLHFHDDESPSTIHQLSSRGQNLPAAKWGGEDLLNRVRTYAHLLRSVLEPDLFLVNPNRQDIEIHSTPTFSDSAVDDILSPLPPQASGSGSGHNLNDRVTYPPSSSVHSPRTTLLSTFSQLTRSITSISNQVLTHPNVHPHLPKPVKSLITADQPQFTRWSDLTGVGEYDSARIYLAKWARLVAEEGERSRKVEVVSKHEALPNKSSSSASLSTTASASEPGSSAETESGSGELGVWEVLRVTKRLGLENIASTRKPGKPIRKSEWDGWFDGWEGKPVVEESWMREEVFKRGIDPGFRSVVWPFLLGVIPWQSTAAERQQIWNRKADMYHALRKSQTLDPEVLAQPEVIEEIHRIEVDCRRTDRNVDMFLAEKGEVDSDGEDAGEQGKNDNVQKMAEILLTYGFFEKELGYVQGMSDLCAPVYVVMKGDEVGTFWCFVEWMERMKQNFLRDQSGMKQQLLTLQQLISVMDSELYGHLEKMESLNLFFCFRWILIAFKREFAFDDVIRLWEVLFTNHYSSQFVLFIALAVLHSHRDVILRYLSEFDEILKYCNDLGGCIDVDSTIAQAEVLFVSFKSLVEDVDRRQALREPRSTDRQGGIHRRKKVNQSAQPMEQNPHEEDQYGDDDFDIPTLPVISDELPMVKTVFDHPSDDTGDDERSLFGVPSGSTWVDLGKSGQTTIFDGPKLRA